MGQGIGLVSGIAIPSDSLYQAKSAVADSLCRPSVWSKQLGQSMRSVQKLQALVNKYRSEATPDKQLRILGRIIKISEKELHLKEGIPFCVIKTLIKDVDWPASTTLLSSSDIFAGINSVPAAHLPGSISSCLSAAKVGRYLLTDFLRDKAATVIFAPRISRFVDVPDDYRGCSERLTSTIVVDTYSEAYARKRYPWELAATIVNEATHLYTAGLPLSSYEDELLATRAEYEFVLAQPSSYMSSEENKYYQDNVRFLEAQVRSLSIIVSKMARPAGSESFVQ